MFRLPTLAVVLLWCLKLDAQIVPFKNYGVKDGLYDNNVQAVIRDNRGLLWVGTDFGINWFDGKKFYKPPVKANVGQLYVTGFYKDHKGVIWVLTFFNGIYKYQNGHFKNYLVDSVSSGSPNDMVSDMLQLSDGKYLVVDKNCPYLFDGERFSNFDRASPFLKEKTNSVLQLPDGSIVLGTDDGVFFYNYNNGNPRLLKRILTSQPTKKVLVIENQLWVLTNTRLLCFAHTAGQPFSNAPTSYLINKPLKFMTADRDGTLWAIADNGSFWALQDTVFKIKNGKATSYSKRNGLPENIAQIYCDDEGLVWLANTKGIGMIGDEYYSFNKVVNGGYNSPITSLIVDNKNLWAGTINGLALKKDNQYLIYRNTRKAQIGYVNWQGKTRDGYCLAGADIGVLKIEGNSIKNYLNIRSTAMCLGSKDSILLGGVTGEIWAYDGKLLKRFKIAHPITEMITAMHADKNTIWIGYRDAGVVKYKIKNDSLLRLNVYNAATGYRDMRIRCCAADKKGNIIWGTRTNGLFVFSMDTGRPVAHITTQTGLNANWIKDLMCDNDGVLYLATNQGISIVKGNYQKPDIKTVKIDDDNINRETNCIIKEDNIFYVGTNEGILTWMPGNIRRDTVSPPVYFTKISIQGQKDFSVDPYHTSAPEISLPYDQHFISFEFAGISLKAPEKVLYHYALTGQDNDWEPLTEHNDVSYDLKPGNYTFKVTAENADGIWSRNPATFHFIIRPPFWQTWWFIMLVAAVIIFAAYSAYRYKLSKLLALEMLRNKISTDLHDDIGSTLSSISILSEVAVREKEQKSKKILAEINERSQLLMEKMDDIVWSISTRNDTVGNLFIRIQQFASTVLEAKDIDYEVIVPEKVKGMKLDMQQRQHIYLILKEAINNLIKYSRCSTVCIVVEHTNGLLTIEVTDDGEGFDTGKTFLGNGLLNMRKRTKAMRGNLHIASAPGKGTRVNLAVEIE